MAKGNKRTFSSELKRLRRDFPKLTKKETNKMARSNVKIFNCKETLVRNKKAQKKMKMHKPRASG